jgi:hypothetical protein
VTHTKDKLADELRKVGLTAMADRAATGWYHDYLSPLPAPTVQLISDLLDAARAVPKDRASAILVLRDRAMNDDFEASEEEGDDWAKSPEGQQAFASLIKGRP